MSETKPKDVMHEVPEGGWQPMRDEVWKGRVKRMKEARREFMKMTVDELLKLVKLVRGNSKTGNGYYTISLIPILDCAKKACKACGRWCYDVQSVCITNNVIRLRAINSALHKKAPEAYWNRVKELCKLQFVEHLRINVGGDITLFDLGAIIYMACNCPKTVFHVFTKNYDACNSVLTAYQGKLPPNIKLIYSRWPGVKCDNPYKIPECHVDFGDGKCEAPADSQICEGNCTKCAFEHTGCHGLNRGEAVAIKYHTNIAFGIQKKK